MSKWLTRWFFAERPPTLVETLRAELAQTRTQVRSAEHALLNSRIRVELQQQALTKAETDVRYWRERAERFIDQVGLKSGIIAMPTMTETVPAPQSSMDSVFSALGSSEINRKQPPVTGPSVLGVDAQAAQAAIESLLERTGTV